MSKYDLLAYQVIGMLIALGVFFAYLLGLAVTQGGEIKINMTLFNEMYIEYAVMVALTATAPWALWWLTRDGEPPE